MIFLNFLAALQTKCPKTYEKQKNFFNTILFFQNCLYICTQTKKEFFANEIKTK